jgi:hypothetical protein
MTREEEEVIKIVTKQKQRDNLIRENAAKFAEEFENSSSTINPKVALFDGFKFGAYWADEHPYSDIKGLLHVVQNTTESTKKEIINKACEWLENELYEVMAEPNHYYIYDVQSKSYNSLEVLINGFKKAMEE